MVMPIVNLLQDAGPSVDYDASFRAVLEDHMTYLRNHPGTETIQIVAGDAYKYEFDLFGLLAAYQIPPNLHFVTMRMNGFTSPQQATAEIETLIVPSGDVIGQIRQTHQTVHKLS
jgi:hypothetical protein